MSSFGTMGAVVGGGRSVAIGQLAGAGSGRLLDQTWLGSLPEAMLWTEGKEREDRNFAPPGLWREGRRGIKQQ